MYCIHDVDETLRGIEIHIEPYSKSSCEPPSTTASGWCIVPPAETETIFLTIDQIRNIERVDGRDFEFALDLRSST
jgi:hypothetical protein